jgi:hypothetical protein
VVAGVGMTAVAGARAAVVAGMTGAVAGKRVE